MSDLVSEVGREILELLVVVLLLDDLGESLVFEVLSGSFSKLEADSVDSHVAVEFFDFGIVVLVLLSERLDEISDGVDVVAHHDTSHERKDHDCDFFCGRDGSDITISDGCECDDGEVETLDIVLGMCRMRRDLILIEPVGLLITFCEIIYFFCFIKMVSVKLLNKNFYCKRGLSINYSNLIKPYYFCDVKIGKKFSMKIFFLINKSNINKICQLNTNKVIIQSFNE